MREITEKYKDQNPSNKELEFIHFWENQRQFPKWKYILFHGILREGFLLFTVIKIIQLFLEQNAFMIFYSSLPGIIFLLFEIVFWIFGGFVIGWFKYNSREIEYELLKGMNE